MHNERRSTSRSEGLSNRDECVTANRSSHAIPFTTDKCGWTIDVVQSDVTCTTRMLMPRHACAYRLVLSSGLLHVRHTERVRPHHLEWLKIFQPRIISWPSPERRYWLGISMTGIPCMRHSPSSLLGLGGHSLPGMLACLIAVIVGELTPDRVTHQLIRLLIEVLGLLAVFEALIQRV